MNKQLKMQHKEQKQGFLFLYALSQELKDRAKAEGFDVLDFIPQLRKIYQVRELKRNTIVDAFAVTNQFKYIIILAHHNKDNSLVLSDESHLSMSHLINLLPDDLQESVLDFAICKSDSIADIIKAKTHCEHVLSTKGYTDLKPRFLTYLFLPGYMKAHPETDDYLKAYSSCLNELKQKVGKKNLRPSTTKLGDSTESSNDSINTSVYSPNHVIPGYKFKIQIFLHYDTEKGIVHDIAIGRDHETEPHLIPETLKGIRKGDEVEIKLSMQDAKGIPTNHIKIFGKECSYSEIVTISDKFVKKVFDVIVCEKYLSEVFWAVVEFIKDGKSIIEPYDYKISIKQESSQKINIAKLVDAIEGGHKDFAKASNTRITDNGIDTKGQYETTEKPEKKDENLSIDIILKRAVEEIKEDKNFKHKYDYAFIMNIINETGRLNLKDLPTIDLPHFNTPQSFLIYLNKLGIYDLPKADSIKKKLSSIQTKSQPWTFRDKKGKDITETKRRNNVAKTFLRIVIEIVRSHSGR